MKEKLKIGIVGSRRRATLRDRQLVYECVKSAVRNNPNKDIVIVSGACRSGADSFAAEAAKVMGVELLEFPVTGSHASKWSYAQEAFARNELIAEHSDMGFALCHPDRTGGTENTVSHYIRMGKRVFNVLEDGSLELLKK